VIDGSGIIPFVCRPKNTPMTFLSNEEPIVTSNGSKIVLTNYRILMNDKSWGSAYMISIFLEDVSSIQTKYSSYIVLIILALLSFGFGGVLIAEELEQAAGLGAIAFGVMFILLYFFTRRHMSNGGVATNFSISGMKNEAVEKFINDVSEAKLKRVQSIHQSQ
jgi:hypothetical protein